MGYYNSQQVCLNGHQITDSYENSPQFRKDFCPECGAKTIYQCENCKTNIPGHYNDNDSSFIIVSTRTAKVPSHCTKCGKPFPWAKKKITIANGINKFTSWYKGLTMFEKISLYGSLASIIGLVLFFIPSTSSSTEPTAQTTVSTAGNQSPAIGSNNGSVTINYGGQSSSSKTGKNYILRNPKAGATAIINSPSLDVAINPANQVCIVPAGTQVILLGDKAKSGGIDMWRKVKVVSGECANKMGWVDIGNIVQE